MYHGTGGGGLSWALGTGAGGSKSWALGGGLNPGHTRGGGYPWHCGGLSPGAGGRWVLGAGVGGSWVQWGGRGCKAWALVVVGCAGEVWDLCSSWRGEGVSRLGGVGRLGGGGEEVVRTPWITKGVARVLSFLFPALQWEPGGSERRSGAERRGRGWGGRGCSPLLSLGEGLVPLL